MDAGNLIAGYAAVVATIVALSGGWVRYRERPEIHVTATVTRTPAGLSEASELRGTIHEVDRGGVLLREEVLLSMNVVNRGRRGVQVTGVVIESLSEGDVQVTEIVPEPLPTVVEPLTSVEVTFEKEFIDNATEIALLGVVDALGRKHRLPREEVTGLVESSWGLPTRLEWYRRRAAPRDERPITAFQTKDRVRLSRRPRKRWRDRPIVSRPPLAPTDDKLDA